MWGSLRLALGLASFAAVSILAAAQEFELPPAGTRLFTAEELSFGDGQRGLNTSEPLSLLMSVRGVVFDLSGRGAMFYEKGEAYNVLIGRDSTRAIGKMSLHAEDLRLGCDLATKGGEGGEPGGGPTERELLGTFYNTYVRKYPIAGGLAGGRCLPKEHQTLRSLLAEVEVEAVTRKAVRLEREVLKDHLRIPAVHCLSTCTLGC